MKNIIITGAGRGLGKSLAETFASSSTRLFLIGRNQDDLDRMFLDIERGKGYSEIIKYDLEDIDNLDNLIENIVKIIKTNDKQMVSLITNAGTIYPINKVGDMNNKEMERSLILNCMSPLLLINSFINKTKDLDIDLRVINISSGAANKPLDGWSLYSSSKSAVHSFIKTIYIEQENKSNPVKVVSFDPGVMNTDMQKHIREVPKEQFSKVDLFNKFHEEGKLRETKDVALKIKEAYIDNWLAKETFESIWDYEEKTEEDI